MKQRIDGVTPPYEPGTDRALHRWMPPGVAREPLMLFKVLERHPELASRMRALGAGLLVHGRLSDADRELVIARVAARSGCAYEWGVHMATYAETAGLTARQVTLTATGGPDHPAWSGRQAALLRAVDELHDTARVGDAAWSGLREHFDEPEVLELLVLAGWYRTIAYVANGARIEPEPWALALPGTDRPSG
ncbi:Alkylhydroperoxidase family enzyme, contains CxxC motif [Streptomyces sp. OV198]|jgi:alkylhydroperoxidase family enzyme|uniref:carboxymuconolactone decarboxylase family protein n=1 Tax=unclassified Streptomyces TaxID=2593676 RepID=UPI000BB11A07|nr:MULTISPECIES: carboxymuconolactone decarboxylase family protein [unclassified Streptomyces]PBD00717.1 alkylhydroperoxidase family enzyme [Streptomyces sp. Ag82_O1-15]SOE77524.1 Alkylhydroperoxidase family enzyme, contains CxxC motif [Streptomyces sp. OV198]